MLKTTYKCDSCGREFDADEYFKYSAKCPDCKTVLQMNTGYHAAAPKNKNDMEAAPMNFKNNSETTSNAADVKVNESQRKNTLNEKFGDYFDSSKINTEQKIANQTPLDDIVSYDENKKREVVIAEILLPSKNVINALDVSQIMSTMPSDISFEYFVKGADRHMLIRGQRAAISYITGIIATNYPAATVQILEDDPTVITKSEGLKKFNTVTHYKFIKEDYFPLRYFDNYEKNDPVMSILAGLHGLNEDESILIQFKLVGREKPEWVNNIQYRIKAESQKGFITNSDMQKLSNETSVYVSNPVSMAPNLKRAVVNILLIVFVPFILIFGLLKMFLPMFLCLGFSIVLFLLRGTFTTLEDDSWNSSDLDIIADKVNGQELFNKMAITTVTSAKTESASFDLAARINLTMNQYSISGGNSLTPKETRIVPYYQPVEYNDDPSNTTMYFSNMELASVWHIPFIKDNLAPGLIAVRGVEMRLPEMADVAGFYKIGEFQQPGGRKIPVNLNKKMLKHNMFLIGKPGTGKTTMMEHLAAASFRDGGEDAAIIVIDPHGDMFKRLTGMIPKERIEDVVLLDFGDPDYVVSYNPLDVKTNKHTVDEATHIIVDIGKSLWSTSWGPRMQIPLQRTVTAIAAHNANSGQAYMDGLSMLGPFLTTSDKNRANYINEIEDEHYRKMLTRYFSLDFKNYNANMREQIIMPVLSKSYRFEESPALEFFSPAETKFDPGDIIRNKKILLVNTRMSKFGSELSNFLGSLIINVILREISRQGETDNSDRVPVLLIIDEFQTFTGVPWQELLAQLRKWGGRTVLGTQSFASMISEDSKQLPEIIMSGVYSIVTFTVNGEDAEYLSKNEFSAKYGGPSQNTLISLAPHTCYARFLREDNVLSRPFFFNSTKPFEIDEEVQKAVFANRAKYSLSKAEAVAGAVQYMSRMESVMSLQEGNTHDAGNGDKSTVTAPETNQLPENSTPVESQEVKKDKDKDASVETEIKDEPEVTNNDFSNISIDVGEI